MIILKNIVLALIGFCSGAIVSGGIFAFISMIGIIPRFAQKTRTTEYVKIYEDAIICGGIFGGLTMYMDFSLPIGILPSMFITLCIGIFFGSLAVSLAEVLNVIPVFMRRVRLTKGIPIFITALAVGKFVGSLLYLLVPYYQN